MPHAHVCEHCLWKQHNVWDGLVFDVSTMVASKKAEGIPDRFMSLFTDCLIYNLSCSKK